MPLTKRLIQAKRKVCLVTASHVHTLSKGEAGRKPCSEGKRKLRGGTGRTIELYCNHRVSPVGISAPQGAQESASHRSSRFLSGWHIRTSQRADPDALLHTRLPDSLPLDHTSQAAFPGIYLLTHPLPLAFFPKSSRSVHTEIVAI